MQLGIYNELDAILWKDWDPIGVHGIEQARDEYYDYLPALLEMVLTRVPAAEIARRLHHIASETMGLTCSLKDHEAVAQKIYALGDRL